MTNSDLPSSLRYTNDNMAGFHRESDGDAFVYSDENRIKVKDKRTLISGKFRELKEYRRKNGYPIT